MFAVGRGRKWRTCHLKVCLSGHWVHSSAEEDAGKGTKKGGEIPFYFVSITFEILLKIQF